MIGRPTPPTEEQRKAYLEELSKMTPEQSKQSESVEVIAKTIIEEMIQYEAWRDGIVVNDLPFLKSRIVKALQAERTVQAGLEADVTTYLELTLMAERDKKAAQAERDALKKVVGELVNTLRQIVDQHMSCEQPTEAEEREVHRMFHLAQSGLAVAQAWLDF